MRLGHGLILCAVALLTIGVVMVTSAGLTVDAEQPISLGGILLGRHATFALLALGALALGSLVPVDRLYTLRGGMSPIPWLVVGMILLLLAVHLPVVGREINGARRWLQLGPLSFQPSEVAKWALPVVVAWHCCRRMGSLGTWTKGFVPPIAIAGAVCALIAFEDLGTAVLVFGVCVAMLLAAGARVWHAALLAVPAGLALLGLIATSPYRLNRVLAYLDPYQAPQGIGYHIIQSIAAVAGGGISGRGLGNSIQKFGYLPEDTTDFIFAIVCEELGVAGALVVVALYIAIVVLGLGVVRRAGTPFTRLLALGFVLTIGFQAVMNVFVVTGLAPTKGIALPLLSRGGTGWLLTAFAIGMLVSIDREAALREGRPSPSTTSGVEDPPEEADSAASPDRSEPAVVAASPVAEGG